MLKVNNIQGTGISVVNGEKFIDKRDIIFCISGAYADIVRSLYPR
jgi:hypothetical protein